MLFVFLLGGGIGKKKTKERGRTIFIIWRLAKRRGNDWIIFRQRSERGQRRFLYLSTIFTTRKETNR